jgi:hypothetical protein
MDHGGGGGGGRGGGGGGGNGYTDHATAGANSRRGSGCGRTRRLGWTSRRHKRCYDRVRATAGMKLLVIKV